MIVVDASVLAVALADDGPDGDIARVRLHGESLAGPDLIDLEVLSVFRRQLASGRLDRRRADLAVRDLVELPLQRVPQRQLVPRVWELRDNLTPYDAAYVVTAEVLDAVLVTADQHLVTAPRGRCSIELVRR